MLFLVKNEWWLGDILAEEVSLEEPWEPHRQFMVDV